MQKITPHLWYDKEAKEAANFYTSLFPNSSVSEVVTLHDTPSGDTDIVSFNLSSHEFMAMNAGPAFKFNPAISFIVNFDPSEDPQAREHIDLIWERLADGGKILMPIQKYQFSERYGWVQDKFGLSWQLISSDPQGEKRPLIIPSLLFTGSVRGMAEEAINFYLSVFSENSKENTKMGTLYHYEGEQVQDPSMEGKVMFADFMLLGQWFSAMDGSEENDFVFNESISFMVECENQEEIDYYWNKLSAVPESEQCGWLKDKFGDN